MDPSYSNDNLGFESFDSQMIRNQNRVLTEISDLSQRMDSLETQLETIINGQHSIIGTINRSMKKNKRQAARKTKEVKFIKQEDKPLSPSDVSKLVHLPEALQRNISKFTQNIRFTSSNIRDDLVSMQCLSEDESTDIACRTHPKDQVRLLVRKIKSRGPETIAQFLKEVEKENPGLSEDVYTTLEEIVNDYKDRPPCAICVMKNTVDLKDIVDSLWEEKIISDDIFQDITESNSLHFSRPLIWRSIMATLNDLTEHGKAKLILIKALKPKYDYIVGYINQNPDRPSLNCWSCTKCRQIRHRPLLSEFGSQTDVSLSSSKLPKFSQVLEYDNVSEDNLSSSLSLPSNDLVSYHDPDYFDNIQSQSIDSTTGKRSTYENGAENINNQEHFAPEAVVNKTSLAYRDGEPEGKELRHSISTVSTTSTLCPEISGSAPNTAGIDSNDTFQASFQLELKEDHKTKSTPNDKSNQVSFQLSSNMPSEENQTNKKDQEMDDEISSENVANKDNVAKENIDNTGQDIGESKTGENADNTGQANGESKTGENADNKHQSTEESRTADKAGDEYLEMDDFETRENHEGDNLNNNIDKATTSPQIGKRVVNLEEHEVSSTSTDELSDAGHQQTSLSLSNESKIKVASGDKHFEDEYQVSSTTPDIGYTPKSSIMSQEDTTGQGTMSQDDTTGQCTMSQDDTTGQGTMSQDDTTGQGTVSQDDTTVQSTVSQDDTAGQGTVSQEDTRGQGAVSQEDMTGQEAVSQDDTTVQSTMSQDDTTRQGTMSQDDTTVQGTMSQDDTVGQGDVSQDVTTGQGSVSQDTTGQGSVSHDDTTVQSTVSQDDTTGQGTLSQDDTTVQGTMSQDDTAGQGDVSQDVTTGQGSVSQDTTGQGCVSQDDITGPGAVSQDGTTGQGAQSQENTTGQGSMSQDDRAGQGAVSQGGTTGQGAVSQGDTKGQGSKSQEDTRGQGAVSQENTTGHGSVSQDMKEQACSGEWTSKEQVRKEKNKRKPDNRKQRKKQLQNQT